MILHITKGHWNDNITLNIEMIVRVRKEIKNQPVINREIDNFSHNRPWEYINITAVRIQVRVSPL